MTLTYEDIEARLDTERIRMVAREAAHELTATGHVLVVLEPGDHTLYRIMIVAKGQRIVGHRSEGLALVAENYWVALCNTFGLGYEWTGDHVHPDYAGQKWASRFEHHTGVVMASFLNALSDAMKDR